MTIRPLLIAAALLVFTSPVAFAHIEGHDNDEEKLLPNTCAELADPRRYSNDMAYPQVKELKLHCDESAAKAQAAAKAKAAAEAKAAAKARAAAKAKARANATVKPAASSHSHSHSH